MTKTTTRKILEGLNTLELKALRRRADWCGASYSSDRDELIKYINSSVTENIESNNLTVEGLVREIKNNVIYLGPYKLETQIKDILEPIFRTP